MQDIISQALDVVAEMSSQETDGTWLEDLTVQVGPHIREWDISHCYQWGEWPGREINFPGLSTKADVVGIDVVGVRHSDGAHVAIQCKSRKLDKDGNGDTIPAGEIDKLANTSQPKFWAERWVVTNGNNPLSRNVEPLVQITGGKPIKLVNVAHDLHQQRSSLVINSDTAPANNSPLVPAPPRLSQACRLRLLLKASAS